MIFTGYLATLAPDIQWLDSSELQAAALLLGNGHPPGEPLYSIVSHALRFVPIGSLAFRITLASALCGVLAMLMVYAILIRVTILLQNELKRGDRLVAAGLTLFLAFSHALWIQTVRSEVYSLNLLLTAVIVFLCLGALKTARGEAFKTREDHNGIDSFIKSIYLISFLLGVASANHSLLIALAAPPILLCLVLPQLSVLRFKAIALSIFFFILGLSIYLYLPLRAITAPPVNWGNPDSLQRVIWMISGKMFQRSFHITTGQLLNNLRETIFILMSQINLGLFFMGLLGLWLSVRRQLLLGGFLISALGFNLLSVITQQVFIGTNPDLYGYLLPAVLMLIVGVHCCFTQGLRLLETVQRPGLAKIAAPAILILMIALTSFALPDTLKATDKHDQYSAGIFGKAVLDTAEPNSYVVTSSIATLFTTWYLQYVERYRQDVIVIHNPFLPFDWYMENLQRAHRDLHPIDPRMVKSLDHLLLFLQDRPVYVELGLGIDDRLIPFLTPRKLLFEYDQTSSPISPQALAQQIAWSETFEKTLTVHKNDLEALKSIYWHHYCNAIFYAKRGLYDQARWEFERCLRITPNASQITALMRQLDVEKNTGRKGVWKFEGQRTSR